MASINYNVRRDPFSGRFATAENAKNLQAQFLDYAKAVKKNIIAEYYRFAPEFVKSIDSFGVPIATGNMHDGIGVGILVNRNVRKWHGEGGWRSLETATRMGTSPRRITPKTVTGHEWKLTKNGKRKLVQIKKRVDQRWGTFGKTVDAGRGTYVQFLGHVNKEIRRMHTFPTDVTIVLYATMPYSQPINDGLSKYGENAGWFEPLIEGYANQLENGIKRAFLRTKPTLSGKVQGKYENKKGGYSPFGYEFNLRIAERLRWYKLIR